MNNQLEIIIDREIWNRLTRISISSAAMRCLTVILGKTHGIGKTSSQITLFQFVSTTGIQKPHICRALNKLRELGIIVAKSGKGGIGEYSINLDFTEWKPLLKKEPLPKKVKDVAKIDNEEVPQKEENSSNEVMDITEENEDNGDMGRWW